MSLPRFLHNPIPPHGMTLLDEAESRHARNVLRMSVGDRVVLFDGVGGEAVGKIIKLEKRGVEVEILQRSNTNRELVQPLEMLVALPKGDRQRTLVDGLVQLGATRLIPLVCDRGVAQPTGGALARLRRGVIESSKQCGRNQLMEICEPMSVWELTNDNRSDRLSLLAHPYGCDQVLGDVATSAASEARMAVGPEGGFAQPEVERLLAAAWKQISLGPRILRIEIASLQLAAWWANRQRQAAAATWAEHSIDPS